MPDERPNHVPLIRTPLGHSRRQHANTLPTKGLCTSIRPGTPWGPRVPFLRPRVSSALWIASSRTTKGDPIGQQGPAKPCGATWQCATDYQGGESLPGQVPSQYVDPQPLARSYSPRSALSCAEPSSSKPPMTPMAPPPLIVSPVRLLRGPLRHNAARVFDVPSARAEGEGAMPSSHYPLSPLHRAPYGPLALQSSSGHFCSAKRVRCKFAGSQRSLAMEAIPNSRGAQGTCNVPRIEPGRLSMIRRPSALCRSSPVFSGQPKSPIP